MIPKKGHRVTILPDGGRAWITSTSTCTLHNSFWLLLQLFWRLNHEHHVHWTPKWVFTTTSSVNFCTNPGIQNNRFAPGMCSFILHENGEETFKPKFCQTKACLCWSHADERVMVVDYYPSERDFALHAYLIQYCSTMYCSFSDLVRNSKVTFLFGL